MSGISGIKRPRPAYCEGVGTPQVTRPFTSDVCLQALPLDLVARIGSYLPFDEAKKLPLVSHSFVSRPKESLEKLSSIFFLLKLCVESTSQLKISTYIKLFDQCKKLRLEGEARALINSIHKGLFDPILTGSQESISLAQRDSLDSVSPTPYEEVIEICLDYGFSEKLLEILNYPQSILLSDETLESIAYHAVENGFKLLLHSILERRFSDPWCKWEMIPDLLLKSVLFNQRALFDELSTHPIIADGKFPKGLLSHAVKGASQAFVLDLLKEPTRYEIDPDDIAQSLALAIKLNREDVLYELLFHRDNTSPIKEAFLQACTTSSWTVIQKILSHALRTTLSYSDIAGGCRILVRRVEISSLINLIYTHTGPWGGLFASSLDEWILLIARNENPDLKKTYSNLFKYLINQGLFHISTEFFAKLLTRAIENPRFPKEDFDVLWKGYFNPSLIPLETYFYFCDLSFLHGRKDLKLWEIDPRFTLPLFAKWCEEHRGSPQSDRFIASQVAASS